ncbi:MAG: methyltransferase domain-containing protein, partial [Eubacterium sp.]|nr:methyltransferase domain-containing protein [Eubacterium sp.]
MCNHFYECGGCTYQTFAYTNQLKLKEQMVKELLSQASDFEWEGILSSPSQFRYRNKMEFTFGDYEKDGPLTLGLHRKNSTHDILTIDSCAIVNPVWNKILKYTQNFFRKYAVPHYNKRTHEGILRNLVIRESKYDGSILVNLVTTTHMKIDENTRNIPWNEKRSETVDELHLPEYVAGLLSLGDELPRGLDGYSSHGYGKNKKHPGHGRGVFNSLSNYCKIAGVLYTECDTLADAIIPDSVTLLYGEDYLMEEVLGLKFKISPFSFFQTNTKGSEVLYSKAREYALEAISEKYERENSSEDKSDKDIDNHSQEKRVGVIYDLYSGTGTIAQLMASVADKVYGIEIIEEAVEAARENARLNKLTNCEFIAGDVLKKLDELEEKPDLIILDPPRDGINPKALMKILSYGVDNMVYISCKPTSLARDLEIFEANGYVPVKGCCVDMFPNTQHVETVVILSKGVVDKDNFRKVKVDFSLEDMDLTELRGKATYAQVKEYILNEFG